MKLAIDMVDEVMKYSNSPFVLVGSGDADFRRKSSKKAAKKGLNSTSKFGHTSLLSDCIFMCACMGVYKH